MVATDELLAAGASKRRTVKELLEAVTLELNRFEAKKLVALKAELEVIVKKKDVLLDEYEKKYPVLRERWCKQHRDVEGLYESLQSAFPNQDWKKLIRDCICKKQHEIHCLEGKIGRRRHCSQGTRERKRDDAQTAFDRAKAHMETLNANAQKVEAGLADGDKLIKDIKDLVPGPNQAVALFKFWFKLLPLHLDMMPDDVSDECKKFASAESPLLLCQETFKESCDDNDPDACSPEGALPPLPSTVSKPRAWLMSWKKYAGNLDRAWQDYCSSRDTLAEAEGSFKSDPDDLESLRNKVKELNKTFDDRVEECLRQAQPGDTCCPPTTTSQS